MSSDQAVALRGAENLTVNMETGTISLDLPVQLQDRMAGAHVQVLLQPLVGADREKLLRSAGHDDLIARSQRIEQRTVFEIVFGETGQVDIGQHRYIEKHRLAVHQPQPLEIKTAGPLLLRFDRE